MAIVALAFAGAMTTAAAQTPAAAPAHSATHTLAQALVTAAQAAHPDATEIGIELPQGHHCTTIASTDPGDRGEACESDDIQPLRTGKPAVAKESDGYDVSLLLHDRHGRRIGVLGVEMKLTGHTRASALREAQQIERTLSAKIASKAALAGR